MLKTEIKPLEEMTDAELDEIAVREILGWANVQWSDMLGLGGIPPGGDRMATAPSPTTDLNDACQLIEAIGVLFLIRWINKDLTQVRVSFPDGTDLRVDATNIPLAITIAAIRAKSLR